MTNHRKLADVVAYLCAKYPHKSELSNARLTKLVYLADWKSVQDSGQQITDIDWVFNNYGPWVPDVIDAATADGRFGIRRDLNAYGSPRLTVAVAPEVAAEADSLVDRRTANVLDLVMAETQGMYFNPFIRYVYSTLPVRVTPKGQPLPLRELREHHPEAETPIPDAVANGVISANSYVLLRTQLSQLTAERLLDPEWTHRADPPVVTTRMLLPDLRIQRVTLHPNFSVQHDGELLRLTGNGAADGSAEVPADAQVPTGYQADADDSGPWATHLTTRFALTVHASGAAPTVQNLRPLTLDALQLG